MRGMTESNVDTLFQFEVLQFEVSKTHLADGFDPEDYPVEWPQGAVGLCVLL